MKKTIVGILVAALSAWGLNAAETVYTAGGEGWGAALTVASGDTAVLVGAEASASEWTGAITVSGGGTVKTRGMVNVTGATSVATGGTVDVESGEATFAFGQTAMAGDIYVRSGAQLNMNRTDAIAYNGTVNLHIYGTYSCGSTRTSMGTNCKLFLYDGARIPGAGDGNGAFDWFTVNRIVVQGTVTIEAPLKERVSGHTLSVACFENANVKFLGGFVGTSAGDIVKVAATAEEGNTAGTCANATIEVGSSVGTGKLKLSGSAKYTLGGTQAVEANGALDLELVSSATLDGGVQNAPAITGGDYAVSVRLTGDGAVNLPSGALGYNLALGSTTVQLNVGAPTTLAGNLAVAGGRIAFAPAQLAVATTALTATGTYSNTGVATIAVDARTLAPGTYPLISAASGITSLDQFTGELTPPAGGSATLTVADGTLSLVVADSTLTGPLTWRPESADDLGWNATSLNWLLPESVRSGFLNGLAVVFDGAESATGDIVVAEDYRVGAMTISGNTDYTFTGAGTLAGSSSITFTGTGTVVLDGPNLGDQEITIGPGRMLQLGANAGDHALGSRAGLLKIAGGTLDINTTVNNATRGNISHRKRIELSNGGTIVNNGPSVYTPGAMSDVTVVGSGTIGGSYRIDLRSTGGDPDSSTTTLTGDENAVLTVNGAHDVCFHTAQVNIGRIDVVQGGTTGRLRIEQPGSVYNVVNGIHVGDTARLSYYSAKTTAGANIHVDSGVGRIEAESGESTMEGKLIIAEGATAQLSNGATSGTLNYLGKLENSGTLEVNASTHRFRNELPEDFVVKMTGGAAHFTGDIIGAKTLTAADMTGGSIDLVCNDSYGGFPAIETYNITKTGGNLELLPQKAGINELPGVVNMNSSGGVTFVYGPNWDAEYGVAAVLKGTYSRFSVGINSQRPGTLEIKPGSEVVVDSFYTGDNGTKAATGRIIVDAGAQVSVTGNIRNGHWSAEPEKAATHTIEVGGVLDASSLVTYNPYDAPRSQMVLREGGVFKTLGFNSRSNFHYYDGVSAGDGRQWFLMEGGRLELGSSGFTGNTTPGVCKYDFQNGTIVNASGAWGCTQGYPLFFGYEKSGGKVTFDLADNFVNWNTTLAGTSDVTLKGAADFKFDGSFRPISREQGALLGKFTVENTGANDLTTAGVFGGGLKLADGVNAKVAKYSDTGYLFAVSSLDAVDNAQLSTWSYPCVSMDFFNYANTHANADSVIGRKALYAHGRGEFYVPAEKAGTWTFVGNFDDRIAFEVDGTQLFKTTTWSAMGKGQVALTAGWHRFTMSIYGGGGNDGPNNAGFINRMAVGYLPTASDSTNGNDYTPFAPGGELQIRPYANACIWSHRNVNTDWDTTDDWSHVKAMPTAEYMHKGSGLADASSFSGWFSSKVNRFQGWFKVEEDQAGQWTFNMGYDDDKLLDIDGERVVNTTTWNVKATGSKTLAPGWHRWEVRLHDGSGGWGVVASVNNGNALSYIAPGEAEKQFNEVNLKLAATLGDIAVLEPTGIYKVLEVGDGATLTSAGSMAMPIFGTLKGNGALAGAFAFAGDHNAWEVEGLGSQRVLTSCAEFNDATAATFTGLKRVKASFDGKPTCANYVLATAPSGLTTADLADVVAEVTDGVKDYSEKFAVEVKDGNLVLVNRAGGGIAILIR